MSIVCSNPIGPDKAVLRSKFKVANAFVIKQARMTVTEWSSKFKKLESKVAWRKPRERKYKDKTERNWIRKKKGLVNSLRF